MVVVRPTAPGTDISRGSHGEVIINYPSSQRGQIGQEFLPGLVQKGQPQTVWHGGASGANVITTQPSEAEAPELVFAKSRESAEQFIQQYNAGVEEINKQVQAKVLAETGMQAGMSRFIPLPNFQYQSLIPEVQHTPAVQELLESRSPYIKQGELTGYITSESGQKTPVYGSPIYVSAADLYGRSYHKFVLNI